MSGPKTVVVSGPVAGASVELVGDCDQLDRICASLRPWCTSRAAAGAAHAPVRVVTQPAYSRSSAHRHICYESDDEPTRELYVNDSDREIVVYEPKPHWHDLQVIRSIRHVLRWQTFTARAIFLHGGLISFDDIGVGFVGAKRSGKTSSLVSCIRAGATFVVNDDLTVVLDSDGKLVGHGWPRTMALRRDTVLAIEAAEGRRLFPRQFRHPANSWAVQRAIEPLVAGLPEQLWVEIDELLVTLRASAPRPSAPMRALVFPTFDDSIREPDLVQCTPAEASELLERHIETTAVKYDPFLRDWFSHDDRDVVATRRAVDRVPAFRLIQRISDLDESATRIVELASRLK